MMFKEETTWTVLFKDGTFEHVKARSQDEAQQKAIQQRKEKTNEVR